MTDLLGEQKRYYDARAGQYDEWWERQGRYDLGPEGNRAWKAEADHGVLGTLLDN